MNNMCKIDHANNGIFLIFRIFLSTKPLLPDLAGITVIFFILIFLENLNRSFHNLIILESFQSQKVDHLE